MMLLGQVLGLNTSAPIQGIGTISDTPERSPCISAAASKWKSLQQVEKGWEHLSRFQEISYLSLPVSTHSRFIPLVMPENSEFWRLPWAAFVDAQDQTSQVSEEQGQR